LFIFPNISACCFISFILLYNIPPYKLLGWYKLTLKVNGNPSITTDGIDIAEFKDPGVETKVFPYVS